jgi:hypothetical protein
MDEKTAAVIWIIALDRFLSDPLRDLKGTMLASNMLGQIRTAHAKEDYRRDQAKRKL